MLVCDLSTVFKKNQLNKRSYSSQTVVCDMSTVIPDNTFKATTPLVDATVSETLR